MQPYHKAWLSVHPERTEQWLSERMADGFDVHHIDGDHENNETSNLVLIECGDHFMLHGTNRKISRFLNLKIKSEKTTAEAVRKGEGAYNLYPSCCGWGNVAIALGLDYFDGGQAVRIWAQRYAKSKSLPWPISLPRKGRKFPRHRYLSTPDTAA
jgi:hypothetical protein